LLLGGQLDVEPQQQGLHTEAHLAHFIEKERASIRDLQLARLVTVGTGEAALDVAKELRLEERLGESRAIHGNESVRSPA